MILPSIKNLTYLSAVEKHLNFSKAADACFVSQSTLSNGITKLEQDLQVQLLERDNRSVKFTKIGKKILHQAEKIINESHNLVNLVNNSFFESKINIGIVSTIAPFLLSSFLHKVKHKYPKLEFVITEGQSEFLLEKIESFKLDFAIFTLPFEVDESIKKHSVFTDKLRLIKHKTWQNKNIANNTLLLLEEGHCLRTHVIESQDIKQQQISDFSCSTIATIIAMVDIKLGISFVPQMAIDSEILKQYHNITIDEKYRKASRDIGVVYKKNHFYEQEILKLATILNPDVEHLL